MRRHNRHTGDMKGRHSALGSSSSAMSQAIHITGLHKRFGTTPVLQGIDLHIQAGEFVSLLGPSGCGKSTLLRIVAGLETQDAGQIRIGDLAVDGLLPRERRVAMVFQNYALYPHMTVRQNVAMPLVMSRLGVLERQPLLGHLFPGRQTVMRHIDTEVDELARSLELDTLLDRKPGQLSGGQRQRVALARAMVRNPSAFLMDEPLSNLDARLRVQVRDELADLHRRLGATFVYVTHDQTEAMTLSSRVAVMQEGRILQFASPQALYERPANLAVARFVGTPAINVLPLLAFGGECRLLNQSVSVQGLAADALRSGGGYAAIRPEDVSVAPVGGQALGVPGAGSTLALVRHAEHHGAEWMYRMEIPSSKTTLSVRVPMKSWGRAITPGSLMRVGWRWSDFKLFGNDEQACNAHLSGLPEAVANSA
jgi:multiple sugar transport system ATP-binding protein